MRERDRTEEWKRLRGLGGEKNIALKNVTLGDIHTDIQTDM